MGNLEDACRFGNLANTLIERFPSPQLEAKVRYIFWVTVQVLKVPWRWTLGPVLDCHRLAIRSGDIQVSVVSNECTGILHSVLALQPSALI
jgi:hypothetical protein